MFEIENLQVSYGQSQVIHGLNFTANKMKRSLLWDVMEWVKPRCLNH